MMSPSETTELMKNLKRLSDVDEQLAMLNNKKVAFEGEIHSIEQDIKSRKQEIDDKLRKIKEETHQEHKDEVLLKEAEEELEKVQTQLNTAKTNEELRIFKKKRTEIENRISGLEDAVLARLTDLDIDREEIETARENLAVTEEESVRKISTLREEIARYMQEMAIQRGERDTVTPQIPGDVLRKYERVLAKEKRMPVVEVKDRTCQGCYMRVTLQEINRIWQGDDIVLCRHCNRILCLHEEEMRE
jgi:predicted  nucleic acid-binding Zn-ribbon protein